MRAWLCAAAVVASGCLGGEEASETGATALEGAPVLLNGLPAWGGDYVAIDDAQEIQKIEVLPCWLRVTYRGGTTLSGNYEARSWGDDGLLQLTATEWHQVGDWPVGGAATRHDGYVGLSLSKPAVWHFSIVMNELTVSNVSAPGWSTGSSRLSRTSWTAGSRDQRWCLTEELETRGNARRPDGLTTWVPEGMSQRTSSLTGVYRAVWPSGEPKDATEDRLQVAREFSSSSGNLIELVTIGDCYVTLCDHLGQCAGGNYVTLADEDGWTSILDFRSSSWHAGLFGQLLGLHELGVHWNVPPEDPIDWDGLLLWTGRGRVVLERVGDAAPSTGPAWCEAR